MLVVGLRASSIVTSAAGGISDPRADAVVFEADGGALKMLCCSSVAVTSPAAAEGIRNVPSSFAIESDFVFAYAIF
jgi:hypothetical protein